MTRLFFQKRVVPWLFLLPMLVLNAVVLLGPSIGSIYYSFTEWRGFGEATWVGLGNFRRAFDDRILGRALRNNVVWMGLSLVLQPAVALFGAALLREIKRGQRVFRAIFFLPIVVSATVAAGAWLNIYHPELGVVSWAAGRGLEFLEDVSLLGNTKLSLYLVFVASLWKGWGFPMVLILAAMQQVPAVLYDAATVDGASRWQKFRHVTLPGIMPTITIILVFTLIGSMLVFNYIYIMTGGGPAQRTTVLALRMYIHAFQRFEAGYGAAIGVMLSIWAGLVTMIFVLLRRSGWEV
jgi:raffinose/stachyose/melibiose transport system permease protein